MIHYHGGPITPESVAYRAWRGRHAFVSWAAPLQIEFAATVCQTFALDNGAFSAWVSGKAVDWDAYYAWCKNWLRHPACDFAIIPDVIEGTEAENDALIDEWPHGHGGVPVWHLNESIDRFEALCKTWPRVALGSAAEYDVSKPSKCIRRMQYALATITDSDGYPNTKLHGLRMLNPALTSVLPLASADSTNVARNTSLDSRWRGPYEPATKETRADIMVERMEAVATPATFLPSHEQTDMLDWEASVG